jgi:hypothetical protein
LPSNIAFNLPTTACVANWTGRNPDGIFKLIEHYAGGAGLLFSIQLSLSQLFATFLPVILPVCLSKQLMRFDDPIESERVGRRPGVLQYSKLGG